MTTINGYTFPLLLQECFAKNAHGETVYGNVHSYPDYIQTNYTRYSHGETLYKTEANYLFPEYEQKLLDGVFHMPEGTLVRGRESCYRRYFNECHGLLPWVSIPQPIPEGQKREIWIPFMACNDTTQNEIQDTWHKWQIPTVMHMIREEGIRNIGLALNQQCFKCGQKGHFYKKCARFWELVYHKELIDNDIELLSRPFCLPQPFFWMAFTHFYTGRNCTADCVWCVEDREMGKVALGMPTDKQLSAQ
jgi:hypothetical protein